MTATAAIASPSTSTFAQSSGIHITFNPNGVYDPLWTPQIVDRPALIANKQVQIGNHTWDHADLRPLSTTAIADELNRNEEWIQRPFGITVPALVPSPLRLLQRADQRHCGQPRLHATS